MKKETLKEKATREANERWQHKILNDKRNVQRGQEKKPCDHFAQELNSNGNIVCSICNEEL